MPYHLPGALLVSVSDAAPFFDQAPLNDQAPLLRLPDRLLWLAAESLLKRVSTLPGEEAPPFESSPFKNAMLFSKP